MKGSKRVLSLLLALLLALSACSTGGKREIHKINWIDAPAYLTEDVPLPVETGDLIGCCTDGETMYILADQRVEEEIRSVLFRVSLAEGTAEPLEEYTPPAPPETAVLNRFGPALAPDGTLWVYETWTVSGYALPEGFDETKDDKSQYFTGFEEFHYLRQLDPATGREKKLVDLSEAVTALGEGDSYTFGNFAVDAGGNIYFSKPGGVAVLNKKGNLQFTIQADLPRSGVSNADGGNLILLPDGSAAVLTTRPGGTREVRSIDPAAKGWGELRCEIPGTELIHGGTGGFLFFYTSGGTLYGWPEEGKEAQALLNWSTIQLNGSAMCFAPMDGGQLAAFVLGYDSGSGDWYSNTLRLALCSPTDSIPEDGRVTLIYGMFCEDEWTFNHTQAHIRAINRKIPGYYVEIRNYGGAGYDAALTRLSADVMSGRAPDLWDESLPIDLYARKGYLEDLWPWIDGDEKLGGREALMSHVLDCASIDGKLYKAGRSFSVQTLVGCTDIVGDRTSWTMDELLELYNALPKGSPLLNFHYNNYLEGLSVFMKMNENRWVDWSTGTCYFDSEDFKAVLALCAGLGEVQEEDRYAVPDPDGGEALRAGRQLLSVAAINNPQDIQYYEALCAGPDALFDMKSMLNGLGVVGNRYSEGKMDAPATYPTLGQEDLRKEGMLVNHPVANDSSFGRLDSSGSAAYIGYPTPEGSGSAFQLQHCAAMSASSAHKEGAWAFIRSLMLPGSNKARREDYFYYGFQGFPINKGDFDAILYPERTWLTNSFTEEYILDPDGNRIEMPVKDINAPPRENLVSYIDLIIIGRPTKLGVYPVPLREEQAQQFMALYESIDRTAAGESELLNIVLEQAQPYFAGDRSLDETARLIQSRATLYVNENR